nr:hypothetical protein [Bacteroidales bacterium]
MAKNSFTIILFFFLHHAVFAQNNTFSIRSGARAGSENNTSTEGISVLFGGQKVVRNVTEPTLTMFLPARENASGKAVIVCP